MALVIIRVITRAIAIVTAERDSPAGHASGMKLGEGVAFADQVGQLIIGQMGVNFRGDQIGMAKQFLNGPQIRPMLQQMGGKGMAEHVGGDMGEAKARLPGQFPDQLEQPDPRQMTFP